MRVWVFGRGFPTVRNNMLGSFELDQAKMLAGRGLDVHYLVIDLVSIRGIDGVGYHLRMIAGVKVSIVNLPLAFLVPQEKLNKLKNFLYVRLCKKIAKKYGNPDIIHIHYPAFFPYEIFEPYQKCGTKIITTEHWTQVVNKTIAPEFLKNLQNYWKYCDEVCCVGNPLKKSIEELSYTKRNVHVIPNIYNPLFTLKNIKHEGIIFFAAGRLVPVKQFDKLIKAFSKELIKHNDARLVIAGNGIEYDKLSKLICDYDLGEKVTLLGEVSSNKIAYEIAASDVVLSYSNLETFCVPVIEAWATGKPVIATEVSVLAENPDVRLGILVDSRNIETLEAALNSMYYTHTSYNSEWIHEYAVNHFSEKVVGDLILNLYL